jgi:hypothetical protein
MYFSHVGAAFLIPAVLAAPQTISSRTALTDAAKLAKDTCKIDTLSVTSAALPKCVKVLTNVMATLKTQEERAIVYSSLMYSSTKYSSILECAAWKSGPKSQRCIDTVASVKQKLTSDADRQFAGYLHTHVFSNPTVAPCRNSASLFCKW